VIHGSFRWVCGPVALDYASFNLAVDQQRWGGGSAWDCVTVNRVHNVYIKGLTFDGSGYDGSNDSWAAFNISAAKDVLFDGVTFQNYPRHASFHMGLINGNSRLDNIFFRNSHFVGNERWAIYLDGCHGCGVVGSTVEGSNFGSGNFLYLTNDDFTYDYNRNGQFDLDEQRSANYIALYRNVQTGYTYQGSSISGGHSLVAKNRYNATYNLAIWSARCSQKWASSTSLVYRHSDIRVRDNYVASMVSDGALGLARFEMGPHNENCYDSAHYGTLGDYSVTNNAVGSGPAGLKYATEAPVITAPQVVSGNCLNCTSASTSSPRDAMLASVAGGSTLTSAGER
jgi:hypothetical protein